SVLFYNTRCKCRFDKRITWRGTTWFAVCSRLAASVEAAWLFVRPVISVGAVESVRLFSSGRSLIPVTPVKAVTAFKTLSTFRTRTCRLVATEISARLRKIPSGLSSFVARSTLGRNLVAVHLLQGKWLTFDAGAAQHTEYIFRHAFRQIQRGVVVIDVDAIDVAAFDTTFIGNGTYNLAWRYTLVVTNLDAVTLHSHFTKFGIINSYTLAFTTTRFFFAVEISVALTALTHRAVE